MNLREINFIEIFTTELRWLTFCPYPHNKLGSFILTAPRKKWGKPLPVLISMIIPCKCCGKYFREKDLLNTFFRDAFLVEPHPIVVPCDGYCSKCPRKTFFSSSGAEISFPSWKNYVNYDWVIISFRRVLIIFHKQINQVLQKDCNKRHVTESVARSS